MSTKANDAINVEVPLTITDTESRSALRKRLRAARNAISNDAQKHAGVKIAQQLHQLIPTSKTVNVASYLASDGEVDLHAFHSQCWANKATVNFSLPVLHPICKGHLLFLKYMPDTLMVENKYRIKEPRLECGNIVPVKELDIILMPLVGFDKNGNRLGMGGGFYDRTLAFTKKSPKKPILMGIAHDVQQVNELPIASWDIPLDIIVTPNHILSVNKQ